MQSYGCVQRREAQRISPATTRQNLTGASADDNQIASKTRVDMHAAGICRNRIITRTAGDRTVRRATQRVAMAGTDDISNIAKRINDPTRSQSRYQINGHR